MMNNFDIALNYDKDGKLKETIENYKLSIENKEFILDSYINLIVLLIELNFDEGVASHYIGMNEISESELDESYDYLTFLIEESNKIFNNPELVFWKYYIENYYKDFDRDEFLTLIQSLDYSPIPYFELYTYDLLNDNYIDYYDKINDLKEKLNNISTFKTRYIKSLIESAEKFSNLSF